MTKGPSDSLRKCESISDVPWNKASFGDQVTTTLECESISASQSVLRHACLHAINALIHWLLLPVHIVVGKPQSECSFFTLPVNWYGPKQLPKLSTSSESGEKACKSVKNQ